jgi:hypothetical protein
MKSRTPIYRLRKGRIYHDQISVAFEFCIVSEEDGEYFFEFFVDETIGFASLFEKNKDPFGNTYLSIEAVSDEGNNLRATHLFPYHIVPHLNKMECECHGRITVEKPVDTELQEQSPEKPACPNLYFLKLEGLKMAFSDHTQIKAYRNHEEIPWTQLQDYNWNHSVCHLQVEHKSYRAIFKNDSDDEIIVEFLGAKYQYYALAYSDYLEFRADFIAILSFVNGAPVRIRTEYTGQFYSQPELDSQVKHIYSFRRETYRNYNGFIPLNDLWSRGDNILNRVLLWDFNRYRYWNGKLGLNGIVRLLGNAEQVRSMEERIFIQMILLERLSDSYAGLNSIQNPKLVQQALFAEITTALDGMLRDFEDRLTQSQLHTLKSRLFGLNDGKRQRTDIKIVAMLEDLSIAITEDIREVISEDRHAIIHKGKVGSGKAFDVLDKLLRQIIVSLIKYTGPTAGTTKGAGGGQPIFENWEDINKNNNERFIDKLNG